MKFLKLTQYFNCIDASSGYSVEPIDLHPSIRHLEALRDATVRWSGGERSFAAGERMHTENSCKWQRSDFEALLRDAGWRQVQAWTDANNDFAVLVAGST